MKKNSIEYLIEETNPILPIMDEAKERYNKEITATYRSGAIFGIIFGIICLFALIGIISLFSSCSKEEKQFRNLKATIRIKAEKITELNIAGSDSIFIFVEGEKTFSFATYQDNCLNKSFGYNRGSFEKEILKSFEIKTEREAVQSGTLKMTELGTDQIIQ